MSIQAGLTQEDISHVQQLADEGRVTEAWQFLSTKGDSYADNAAEVVGDPTSPFAIAVRAHWENVMPGQYD